ncbi:MAG: hypothetical protein HN368_20110 [Spirochaetales bacterium]|nr:hypothetical protein [Spirochaetales bacterium]
MNLRNSRQVIMDTVQNLFLRRSMLTEKLKNAGSRLALEQERLAEKERLHNLKQITSLELDRIIQKVAEKHLAIWTVQMNLFLNTAALLNTAGYDLQTLMEGTGL